MSMSMATTYTGIRPRLWLPSSTIGKGGYRKHSGFGLKLSLFPTCREENQVLFTSKTLSMPQHRSLLALIATMYREVGTCLQVYILTLWCCLWPLVSLASQIHFCKSVAHKINPSFSFGSGNKASLIPTQWTWIVAWALVTSGIHVFRHTCNYFLVSCLIFLFNFCCCCCCCCLCISAVYVYTCHFLT